MCNGIKLILRWELANDGLSPTKSTTCFHINTFGVIHLGIIQDAFALQSQAEQLQEKTDGSQKLK